ncbi:hypothetical protein RR42_m2606 [Cupriavidus basilensis]|uniref:Uncharacterized protein n=1 Tax=Cupriavidus basilensis TaxID=68895 RepID=A0A0C4Y3Y8_9BURK|nr:hypothetical protein RR42_m2606 [Cupriavidus basilensis]
MQPVFAPAPRLIPGALEIAGSAVGIATAIWPRSQPHARCMPAVRLLYCIGCRT